MARKAAMHIQFPIKHKTPRCQLSRPIFRKLDKNHPAGSGWPLALISLAAESASLNPKTTGPRNRTINMAPETQTRVPPTFAWPSVLDKFTLSVLQEQVHIGNWTKSTHTSNVLCIWYIIEKRKRTAAKLYTHTAGEFVGPTPSSQPRET